ncbi:MAG TPA: hypothetical protein VE010_24440 [Thermoanaerobaculia bacterium]|nr:hypothetical protein [Thermoanaerobaculia bacterium]
MFERVVSNIVSPQPVAIASSVLTAELRDNLLMGIAFWLLAGAVAGMIARIIPFARRANWFGEVFVSVVTALLLGLIATAMDFGGWREPDFRAALFVVFGSFAAIGLLRLARRSRPAW